ncbi:hypothetical protein E3V55_04650 [Candidatus Marinimicrobia bacterium MT.SAG.3]|nr:hypothetical protein E3V55_04650 [Candidatus Marinimicrobia bacterium MT.SAG.3]
MFKKIFILSMLSALTIFGCSDDDDDTTGPALSNNTLVLSLTGVETLQNGYHYEGWAIVGGSPVATGKFNVDANGVLEDLSSNAISGGEFVTTTDLTDATAIIITIEPDGDTDANPADTHYLAGSVSTMSSTLTVGHASALGDDYSTATGDYILATPTDGANTNENSGIWFLNPPSTTFSYSLSGVTPLLNGFHYEGWAIVDGAALSAGKFNVDDAGALVDLNGVSIANGEIEIGGDLSAATAIILTIEPDGDTDTTPAATHYLAGSVSALSAALTVGDASALGNDYSTATGDYILATPTDAVSTDENSGIWFLSLASGSPAAGLSLPDLPSGWVYEGWAVINGTPVTTGTFTDIAAADLSAPYSGTEAGPPFPGEDFLNNAPSGLTFPTDLAGATAVISIEPSPDDASTPFTLKPLVGSIATNATDHVTYAMDNNSSGFPTGSVTIVVTSPSAGLVLPDLPSGWVYEGWAVIDGTPVSTGTFTDRAAVDSAAPYSGTESGPPFPGEDFLNNTPTGLTFPTDLAGGTAVISIEPSPDDASTPFTLKPLVGGIATDATDHVTYSMDNKSSGFPSGTAVIK